MIKAFVQLHLGKTRRPVKGIGGGAHSSGIPHDIKSMPQAGMLTFMASETITLCGVKIISDVRPSQSLSL